MHCTDIILVKKKLVFFQYVTKLINKYKRMYNVYSARITSKMEYFIINLHIKNCFR